MKLTALYTTALLVILNFSIKAQNKTADSPNQNQQPSVVGSIIDSSNQSPVEYASISVVNSASSKVVDGTLSDESGNFKIFNLGAGSYYLQIDFIGYKTLKTENFTIDDNNLFARLGKIEITADVDILQEVTVTAERTFIENKIDKKVVNIGKDLLSAGASAVDIMKNIPSVDVDIEGNLSLRGSENVRILVDGRPTNMSSDDLLSSIPAENIEKVEIITNPSAKYDPDGISGIINIILKKDKKLGLNGSVSVGVGSRNTYQGINKYNSSVNINYNTGNWNFFVNYGYRDENRESEGEFERKFTASDGSKTVLNQYSFGEGGRLNHRTKAGVDYNFSDNTNISYSTNIQKSGRDRFSYYEYLQPYQYRETSSDNNDNGINHDLIFRHKFSESSNLEISLFRDDDRDTDNSTFLVKDALGFAPSERDNGRSYDNTSSAQADYVFDNDHYKLEAGAKWQKRYMDSRYNYFKRDIALNETLDLNRSNTFSFSEQLYSAYFNYGHKWEKYSAQIGARIEQALTSSELVGDANSPYNNNYLNLFPSVFVSRKVGESSEIGLSYSKRVSRPSSHQLNPTKSFSDTLNIRMGNPYLNPEFTNSLELSYNVIWKGGSFNSAVFYRTSNDVIQRVNLINSNGVSTQTYDNIANTSDFGYEASVMSKINSWWSTNANINIYLTNLESNDPNLSNDGMNWFFRMNNTFNVSKKFSMQASGRFMGARIIPQGKIDPMYGMDFGVKYAFWNNQANLGLTISDAFNTFKFKYKTTGSSFEESGYRKWESRVAFLTFTYNFGQASKKSRPEKRREGEDGGQGEMEGF